jgi:tRNA (cytidine56-2'-O)-methyltransferase
MVARVDKERERSEPFFVAVSPGTTKMIEVLRIGHRPARDKRITTHVCLVARALGADGVVVDTADRSIERTIAGVNRRFGGRFAIRTGVSWSKHIRGFSGTKVHLTMYGIPLEEAVARIPKDAPVLVIVGSTKVPAQVYEMADINVSVGNQPHSEVAALALFLDRWFLGSELGRDFGGPMKVIPTERGKRVIDGREEE